jgi:tripartite-type tricarboxylate transporter receptor subunit TctC
MRTSYRFLSVGLFFYLLCSQALCADFPARAIRMVVPFAAGGNTDIAARILAQALTIELGQTVFVDNKVGAGTRVGTEEVARSQADGYTLLLTTIGFASNPSLYKSLKYDSKKDFSQVAWVMSSTPVLLVNAGIPVNTLAEFIDYVKKTPGLSYGSAGVGSAMHLHAEELLLNADIRATHIPYRGEGPALVDLLAGRTAFHFGAISSSKHYIESGALKALAVTSDKRSAQLPNVPTMAQAGIPGFVTYTWGVVMVPTGTPNAIVAQLNKAMNRVLSKPEVLSRLIELGFEPVNNSTPESTKKFVEDEMEHWSRLIKRLGLTADD